MITPTEPIARLQDLREGDIGLGPIGGLVGAGVGAGQWLLGEGWTLSEDDEIRIRHAAIVTKPATVAADGFVLEAPTIVEAMPSGARHRLALPDTHWTEEWAWVRIPQDYVGQGRDAAYVADLMARADTPYSVLSYAALSAWRFHIPTPHTERWINRRVPGSATWLPSGGKMRAGLPAEAICSVLVDQCWTLTGKRVMEGVPHQCVTPAALARRLRFGTPGAVWAFPGR
jgi:hypothetical protein